MKTRFAALAACLLLTAGGLARAGDAIVIITHEVKDFAAWKTAYDGDKVNRDKAGLVERALMRAADKPNLVTVVFEAKDQASAKAFTSNPALKEVMIKAGVLPPPAITIGTAVH